ncbi:MAG TPA: hypothetical protein VKR61_01415 [Bryobacteraceae bacterium]|nr:hypothetical protein [Bryobacteraceae bacterium]
MACPYFYPVERAAVATGNRTPPMPLGDSWSGLCRAASGGEWSPDANTAQQLCNFGYARERCSRVPDSGPDAVRFSITHDRGGMLGLYWVVEKDHSPFAHGPLEYSPAGAAFSNPHPDACLAQQARAYATSYLRRKGDSVRQ